MRICVDWAFASLCVEPTGMLDYGRAPIQAEVIEADIEIETKQKALRVWAISPEGLYVGKVPATYEDGKLKFSLGKTMCSMYYLIQAD